MAGKKKTGEIDTKENVEIKPKKSTAPGVVDENVLQQLAQMQDALNKANELNSKFAEQLENANKKSKEAGEKKDNSKPIPVNPRSFSKYITFLKQNKPHIFAKKFAELVEKGNKLGITVTPMDDWKMAEDEYKTTV